MEERTREMNTQRYTWQFFLERLQRNGLYAQCAKMERDFAAFAPHSVTATYDANMNICDVTLEYAEPESGERGIRVLPREYFS